MAQDHYIDNAQFLAALVEFRKEVKIAKKNKREEPPINDYIGGCFLKIAENLARKPNFASYTFREDMIADAVENCLRSIHNFNPALSNNPFSYFTQIVFFAFIRRITNEKKQLYAKYKATQQLGLLQNIIINNTSEIGQDEHQFKVYENIEEFIQTFESKKKLKPKKPAKKNMNVGILRFVGDK